MSEWSKNNLAHRHTWMNLLVLQELSNTTTFDVAGDVPVNGLAFWSDLDSPAMRATKAKTLAAQLDNMFRQFQGASYEPNIDRAKAVQSMADVLQDSAKLVKDLGGAVDDAYHFRNEA